MTDCSQTGLPAAPAVRLGMEVGRVGLSGGEDMSPARGEQIWAWKVELEAELASGTFGAVRERG